MLKERMMNHQLPKGWQAKPLVQLCTLFTDGDWIESKDQSLDGIRLIQTGNVGCGEFKDRRDKARWISQETFEKLKCEEVFPDDCLISRLPDPVGRSCLIPETGDKMITSVDCSIIRLNRSFIIADFFNYYTQSAKYLEEVESKCSGATRKRISRKNLGEVEILLPPLLEQKRIVAILDEAFANISQAVANAEKNLANARELFDSYLESIADHAKPLGTFVDIKTGKLDANAAIVDGKYPFFTCSREIYQIDDYAFDCEAILLAGNNASGDFNVKHFKGKFNAYQRTYVITIKDEDSLLYRFLYYQMIKSLKELKENSVGAGTKFLKLGMIKDLKISIPHISVQKNTLDVLEELSGNLSDLEDVYRRKLAALAELKQALLQKAFTGELTAADQPT
ncbi:restriction endonuclease subunit S [Thiothrix sp.]|jgi:type I restriction enzyme S subunit|uniref:restriction endonuclease subunit S n=1 Tax=Thiothrix sp. TaxID=1032 RepID=UPI00257F0BA6|nr:restriction endonuclease subunit S [Thiothrix sp.]